MTDAQLIEQLGGPAKLAKTLNLPMPGGRFRVQNWVKRGIPYKVKVERPELFLMPLKNMRRKAD